jgi:hypothetical protein
MDDWIARILVGFAFAFLVLAAWGYGAYGIFY